jgi:ABC-type sugar transport system ATPase subunit
MSGNHTHIVEFHSVTKRFPGVLALDNVSLGFQPGEVHAVVGENGAGKSTLMNILAGDLHPTEGEVHIDGKPTRFRSSLDSRAAGVVVVYQELALCQTMTVAENIMMSAMAARPQISLVPRADMRREAKAVLTRLGMGALDPDTKVSRLSIAEKQLVEIAGAIRQNARVLVLDEPNSALSRRESERLFEIVKQLRAEGVTVIYVSHHLREVLAIAEPRDRNARQRRSDGSPAYPRHGGPRPRHGTSLVAG